ncbi:MAG: DUF2177 family protein [Proteobacteria bacterium]|nr:DUF2177 family protein [Pseudomonadota bacterium]
MRAVGVYPRAYLGAGLVFAGLDFAWLSATNASLYRPILAPVLADQVRLLPAVAFYLTYLAGLTVFAIRPALVAGGWRAALILGGLFGFFAYATYDLTNQATLAVWATKLTLMDLAWGVTVSATGATAGYFAATLRLKRA